MKLTSKNASESAAVKADVVVYATNTTSGYTYQANKVTDVALTWTTGTAESTVTINNVITSSNNSVVYQAEVTLKNASGDVLAELTTDTIIG